MTKEHNLKENPSFCMLGLLHTYVSPDGNVMPCCMGDITKPSLGNINDITSWDEIWNGEKYKQFRKNMIEGVENPICSRCYDTEKFQSHSFRTHRNNVYADQYDHYISHLLPSGEMTTDKLKYMDFRFSNKCNQACITCGHTLSSSWYDLNEKLGRPQSDSKFIEPTDKTIAFKLIDDNLDSVRDIYFAGGEPMISEYHWYTLEKLIESGRASEVNLVYSTNCSTLSYRGKDVLEYWKQFKDVMIMASIDEVGERFNYIRWPGKWNKISVNLQKIHDSFEEVNKSVGWAKQKLVYLPVLSSFNIHRLKEIVQQFLDCGIYQGSLGTKVIFEICLFQNLLRNPIHLSIINMPEQHWQYVDKCLTEFEEWYLSSVVKDTPALSDKTNVIKYSINVIRNMRKMKQSDLKFFDYPEEDSYRYMEEYSKMDIARGTNFKETFPELEWLYK
jgi:radical SAM protein with 4Fe4S-binding SPASM domain